MADGVAAGDAEAAVKDGKQKRKAPVEDLQAIQADVASFAASLGFSAAAVGGISSGGFDDSDFRKKGPIRKKGLEKSVESPSEDGLEAKVDSKKEKKERKEKKEKTEKKKGISKDPSPTAEPRKKFSNKPEFEEEDELKPRKTKKDKANGVEADASGKSSKNDTKPEPGSSKIHEVLNSALSGTHLPTNSKKRKGRWNDQQRDEDQGGALPPKRSFLGSGCSDADSVRKLREEAQQLMDKAAQEYERSRQHNSDTQWLMQARRSGTSTDRVAAMTVILQDNPKANVRTLDALIGMLTSKAGKRHAATGIDALKELFMFNLLPDRKLKYFAQQPVESLPENKERPSTLIEWYWEDCLKHRYEKYVLALEEATKDTLSFLKEKALKTVFELLKSKPEQERRLLSTLVNKLGDPERRMASNAGYLLSGLLTAHPNMKKVVVDEVEAFVFRPHVGLRARYYAAVFLNQIVLSNKGNGPQLAKQLIDLYFSLFKAVTYVVDDEDDDSKDKRKKGDKGRKKGFGNAVHKRPAREKEKGANFMMEIDSRLLSALLTGVNRALPYIKAEDLDTVTQENSVLFRLVHSTNFNVAVQALMLLHQLLTKSHAISDRFYRALYSVLLSRGLFKSSKAEMFLGLVYKSLKSDLNTRRISAFAKRLLQVAMHHPPQFACGSLFLLSEVLKTRPSLWNSAFQAEENDDEEEHFEDIKDEDSEAVEKHEDQGPPKPSATEDVWPKKGSYDFKHRDPLYCNAHRTCWWELTALANHVHPSVTAMARTLLSRANIIYNGDPLRDLALGVFLDRFTEKKPKALKAQQAATWHGSSITMPSKMGPLTPRPVGEEFSSLTEDQVAPEDLVFHKFYVTKSIVGSHKQKKKKKTHEDDEDDITGGLLGNEAIDGDDSEDEEVDVLLEKEADLEMDGEGDSDEEDEDEEAESEEELKLDDKDDDGDGSEVDEEYDDSEDEEADALLETGLQMSSGEDDDDDIDMASEDDSLDTIEPIEPSKNMKATKVGPIEGKKAKKLDTPSKLKISKVESKKANQTMKLLPGKSGKRSVFQEAESDDDSDGHV